MEIKKTGSFLEVDNDGFLVNISSSDKIPAHWKPAVSEVVEEYKHRFGDKIVSIYLRGSTGKGESIDYISDLDTFAVVDMKEDEIDLSWRDEFNQKIKDRHPFITGVEILADPFEEFENDTALKILVKLQGVCLYGKDLSSAIPRLKPGKETVQHVRGIVREIDFVLRWLKEEKREDLIKNKCTWIMKRILRAGCEMVMERSQKYSRDLYPCYEVFSEYYPDKEGKMRRVLELALDPTSDKGEIEAVLGEFREWFPGALEDVFGKEFLEKGI